MIKLIKTCVLLSSLLLASCSFNDEKSDYETIKISVIDVNLYKSTYDESVDGLKNVSLQFFITSVDGQLYNYYFTNFANLFDFPKNVIDLIDQPVFPGKTYEITYKKDGTPVSFTGPKERNEIDCVKFKVKQKSEEQIAYDPNNYETIDAYLDQELHKKYPFDFELSPIDGLSENFQNFYYRDDHFWLRDTFYYSSQTIRYVINSSEGDLIPLNNLVPDQDVYFLPNTFMYSFNPYELGFNKKTLKIKDYDFFSEYTSLMKGDTYNVYNE